MTKLTNISIAGLRIAVIHLASGESMLDACMNTAAETKKADVVLRCFDDDLPLSATTFGVFQYADLPELQKLIAALPGARYEPLEDSKGEFGLGKLHVTEKGAVVLEDNEDSYGLLNMSELDLYKRLVQLYQQGAVIEYHDMPGEKKPKRFHVGFRYDCMSDDDYFESRAIEKFLGIEEQPNWRGDVAARMSRSMPSKAKAG